MELGFIRPNSIPYASSVVMVKEKDGTLRIFTDFRDLNKKTMKNRYPIPRIDELLDELHGDKFFSKLTLDLVIIKFEWRNKAYQRLLSDATMVTLSLFPCPLAWKILLPHSNHAWTISSTNNFIIFFDDILIDSKTWKEHLHHLEEVLKIMHDQSLFDKLSKCEFGLTNLLYLGHIIGQYGVKVNLDKIKSIIEWPRPKNLTELRGFIGLCTYYKKFVRSFSQLTSPLTDLTNKDAFQWHEEAEK